VVCFLEEPLADHTKAPCNAFETLNPSWGNSLPVFHASMRKLHYMLHAEISSCMHVAKALVSLLLAHGYSMH
jgi:hypothetical protein